jgi:hypothetical protein
MKIYNQPEGEFLELAEGGTYTLAVYYGGRFRAMISFYP